MQYTYDFPMASLTATVIPYFIQDDEITLIMIRRKFDPFKDCLAFPGGFVNIADKEDVCEAVSREMEEETGMFIPVDEFRNTLLSVNSSPNRDPRGRVVDFCFANEIRYNPLVLKATDDAAELVEVKLKFGVDSKDIPEMAFDHKECLIKLLSTLNKD